MLVVPNAAASTVVIVTWRGAAHIGACLDAVAAQDRPHATLVVDNASDDGTAEIVAAHPLEPRVLRLDRNAGYAGGIAAALSDVDTRYIAWLNDDAVPAADWLRLLEAALDADATAAAATACLEHPDGSVQSCGVGLTADGYGVDLATVPPAPTPRVRTSVPRVRTSGAPSQYFRAAEHREVFGFCGGAALVRADALRAVGGIPSEFFCYYEDTDTSWRLRLAGWRVLAVPAARVRHAHGASSELGSAEFHRWNERNRLLMLIRCAPASVALRELARFALITLVLPVRRMLRRRPVLNVQNFRLQVRLRVLGGVLRLLPRAIRARRAAETAVSRHDTWQRWAGWKS